MTQAESPQSDTAALFDAIRQGDASQVQALLLADPKLANSRNSDGATAVLWTVYTRHAELAPLLLAGREPDFYESCALSREDRVAALLTGDPSLANGYSADGFTGLGLAIFFNHPEIARVLVDSGADVNRPSRNAIGVYPLHSAVASGSAALVDLLLARGATPDVVEFLGITPLHSAAATGNREMVQKLLAAGANRDLKTKDGKSATDLASKYGHAEIAAELEMQKE
jgi:ankyrin repeat protein